MSGQNMIQIARGYKSNPTELTAITGTVTSSCKECRGHNAIMVYLAITGTGTWTITIQGRIPKTDTFVDMYDNNGNLLTIASATVSQGRFMVGLPYDFKIVATEVGGTATASISYELLTV